eukprot:TRINITY_DN944_c0_g1_i3.p1 TRINITY_DN944_c0_g1~~TRINITY_DN944_c0_g1_i3.p1  ORF type:complete len:429 (+),score=89.93 TRINITY_DN944_c0_g1_i3:37-1323(+)
MSYNNNNNKKKDRTFDPITHHPFIEIVKHVTSPLSASLFIFTVGKIAVIPEIKVWWQSFKTIHKLKRNLKINSRTCKINNNNNSIQNSNNNDQQKRSYSSYSINNTFNKNEYNKYTRRRIFNSNEILILKMIKHNNHFNNHNQNNVNNNHNNNHFVNQKRNYFRKPIEHSVDEAKNYWSIESANEVIEHVSNIWLVCKIEQLLNSVHEYCAFSWVSTIIISTIVVRLIMVPFNISALRTRLQLKVLRNELEQLNKEMKNCDCETERLDKAKEIINKLYKHKAHPIRALDWCIPILFPPFLLCYFIAIHNLCLINISMSTGGLFWFIDLMAPDITFFLPIVSAMSWLAVTELGSGAMYIQSSQFKFWTRTLAVAFIPITLSVPSGVLIFWITSNSFEIFRISIMNRDQVRLFLKIPTISQLPPVIPGVW